MEKQQIIDILKTMPQDVSVDELMEQIYFREKLERSIAQAGEGRTVSHDEVRERLGRWLK